MEEYDDLFTHKNTHKTDPHLQQVSLYVLIIICICLYIIAIWISFKSRILGNSTLGLNTLDPLLAVPLPTDRDRKLRELERVSPTKGFKKWWMSVQTENDPLKGSDALFDCAICLELVKKKDPIHPLGCRHVFHSGCLENWFLEDQCRCPICQAVFINMDDV